MYGPTEATIISAVLEIDRRKIHEMENLTSVPIGSGTGNTVLLVLDTYLKLCPGNITGELYIGGDGVAMGYLNNPELTMEKFIFSPNFLTSSLPNFPLYRSGDRVLRLADGNIEFLGRIDQQVKVRGYRIELAEIETALLKNREIKEAVVLTHEDKNGDKYLCAYLVGDAELSIPALRETLAKQLPDYMIPAYYVPLKEIPLTPNGKLDRNALPKPGFKKEEILTPRNEIEAKLVELWADILEIEKDLIGIDSDFFQLGGHSLKATILVSRISKIFNRTVPLIEIFKTPTIQSLAAYINASAFDTGAAKDEKPLLLKPGTDKTLHLFFIHDGTGEVDGYIEFCKHLSPGFHCWGLRADRLENLAPQTWTIETLAKNYIAMIKKVQPHGPYFIIGWSLGGTIAHAMSLQLEQANEEIAFLALVDSPAPSPAPTVPAMKFDLESELHIIKAYLNGSGIEEKLIHVTQLSQLWGTAADALEAGQYDIESIKKEITQYGMPALPNFQQLSIRESLYYLNVGRTLAQARAYYNPTGKVHANVHFFKAGKSIVKHQGWKNYCHRQMKLHKLSGDHYSIFRDPEVIPFAETFNKLLEKKE
jgi:thioesterase domain-containing protein/acyl carrier protein